MKKPILLSLIFICLCSYGANENDKTGSDQRARHGWYTLFDGKTLNNWTFSDKEGTFTVKDGMIVVHGNRSHLFYTGPVMDHNFKNFEFRADVMTERDQIREFIFILNIRQQGGLIKDMRFRSTTRTLTGKEQEAYMMFRILRKCRPKIMNGLPCI
jgi:hypothetical protein